MACLVIPAKAGISCNELMSLWAETPAYAGVTEKK